MNIDGRCDRSCKQSVHSVGDSDWFLMAHGYGFRCARLLVSERHCASRAAFRRGLAMSYHWHGALERTEKYWKGRVAKFKRKESDCMRL